MPCASARPCSRNRTSNAQGRRGDRRAKSGQPGRLGLEAARRSDRAYPAPAELRDLARWRADRYAEGVYFHEFVQSFLFRKGGSTKSGKQTPRDMPWMRLFQRSDIATVEVALEQSRRFRLTVERLNLYLFSSGSAILVLEVSTKGVAPRQSWSLADVQDFHDRFRRAYIPYATVTHGMKGVMTPPGDLVAAEVIWHHQSGPPAKFRSANEIDGMVTGYLYNPGDDGRRIPPVFGPLAGVAEGRPTACTVRKSRYRATLASRRRRKDADIGRGRRDQRQWRRARVLQADAPGRPGAPLFCRQLRRAQLPLRPTDIDQIRKGSHLPVVSTGWNDLLGLGLCLCRLRCRRIF